MHTISITDLNCKISDLIDGLKNQNRQYVIVQDGVSVAMLRPLDSPQSNDAESLKERRRKAFGELKELAKEVSKQWCSDESAAEAVSNDRR